MTFAARLRVCIVCTVIAGEFFAAAPVRAERARLAPSATTPPAPPSPPAAPALAGPGDAARADVSAKDRARSLYEQGAKAYAEGRYHAAADAFLDANRVFPTPQLCFNVAKAYEKLGHASGALRYYREYLRQAENAPDAEETTARVRELEQALAARGIQQLTVLSEPKGATVVLDGQPVGVTPWTGETWPGRHRLSLTLPGYTPTEDLIEIDGHRAAHTEIELAPVRARAQPTPAPAAPEHEPPRVSALTWAALGTGTAALGGALALEMAQGENHGISRTGAFFTGLGAAASTLGGVLLYLDLNAGTSAGSGHALGVGITPAPGGTRATLSGRF